MTGPEHSASERPLTAGYWTFRERRDEYGARWPGPIVRWWPTGPTDMNEVEQRIFDSVSGCARILDVGAGDNALTTKFREAGFRGDYHTLDPNAEYPHEYASIDEV